MSSRWEEMYRQKVCNADEAAKLIQDGDGISCAFANGQPVLLTNAIVQRVREGNLRDIVISSGIEFKLHDALSPDVQDRMTYNSAFVGPANRAGSQSGLYTYMSNRLGQSVEIITKRITNIKNSAVMAVVSPMDEHGYFSSGSQVELVWGSWKAGTFRDLIVEVNENMPRTFGNNHFHVSEISAIVENTTPMVELPVDPISKEDELIGQYIAERVPDGACIQIGIGSMPNAVAKYLKDKKDLGIHSEMLTDSMVDLYYDGVITCNKKNFNRFKMIGSFAFGTNKLYKFIDNNPLVELHCASWVNDPEIIGQNDNMISVNATLEVDLTGQCCSESVGYKQYSGTGGQLDYVQGSFRSKGGQSFLGLYSTYVDKEGNKHSSIKPMLTQGAIVTTPRSEVQNIVTEYGVATLTGHDIRYRVQNLIRIAHPEYRDQLTFEAKKMGYLR